MTISAPAGGYAVEEAFAAMLVGGGPAIGDAVTAIGLLGGRIAQRLDWAAVRRIETALVRPVIVVEVGNIDNPLLAEGLAALDAFAVARELPVVVALDRAMIDPVAAVLFGRHVQLLCEPSIADRVAALAVAVELTQAPVLHDSWRESEATRLHRLNQEVARIAELLARLTREESGGEVEDRHLRYDVGPSREATGVDPQEIRRMIRARRLRDHFFAGGLFEDPAWDMLLDLYAAELEGVRVSVSSLCIAAAVAPTTALRWLTKLTEQGLFVRQPDPRDRRRAFMALAPQTREAMRGYLAAMHRIEAGVA